LPFASTFLSAFFFAIVISKKHSLTAGARGAGSVA